jgi:hypothetical protein
LIGFYEMVTVVFPFCSAKVGVLSISKGHIGAIGWRVMPAFSSEKEATKTSFFGG